MNPYAIISLFSFIVAFFLGNFIYYKNPNNRLNKLIAILCFLVAYLSFVEFGLRQSETISTAYFWLKGTFLWPLLTPLLIIIILEVTKRNHLIKKQNFHLLIIFTFNYHIINNSFNQSNHRWIEFRILGMECIFNIKLFYFISNQFVDNFFRTYINNSQLHLLQEKSWV